MKTIRPTYKELLAEIQELRRELSEKYEEKFPLRILEQIAEAVVVCDKERVVVLVSHAAGDICGGNPLMRTFESVFPLQPATSKPPLERKNDYDLIVSYINSAIKGTSVKNIEMVFLREDGRLFNLLFNVNPLRNLRDEISGCIVSLADITERKQAEKALSQSENIFRQITENSRDIYWLMSSDFSQLLYMSPAYEAVTLRPLGNVYENPLSWLGLVHPDDIGRLKEMMGKNKKAGFSEEFRIVRPDESLRWIWARTFPIRDETGSVQRVLGVAADITERKFLEEELIRVQKLESVGVLAGGIAHDFNNLLTAIIGNISLAKMRIHEKEKAVMILDTAESATMRAAELTQRLITFAKGGAPVTTTVYINELIIDAVRFWLSGSNVISRFDISEDLRPVKVDEGQIRQVIQNIILNARDAMPEGGQVDVTARNVDISGDEGLPLREGAYIRISIHDSGSGIPQKDLSRIFDPYFSTRERGGQKGMGLGLSVCYSVISKHYGHILAESGTGTGTTIHFYLPVSAVEPEGRRIPRILVMDDEAIILELAASILNEIGFEVAPALTGEQAIEMFKAARTEGYPFDAVVLDLTVPGAMGGLQTLRKLISIEPNIRAIVSSGYLNDVVLTNFREYGFMAAIPKPYKPEDLVKIVTGVIGRGSVYH